MIDSVADLDDLLDMVDAQNQYNLYESRRSVFGSPVLHPPEVTKYTRLMATVTSLVLVVGCIVMLTRADISINVDCLYLVLLVAVLGFWLGFLVRHAQ
jgi:hypothetical protein